jgi:hypothetical protein
VAFTASALPRRVINCYCSLCRRSRAAAFGSTLIVPREAFRWDRGETRIRHYSPPATAWDGGSAGRKMLPAFAALRPSLAVANAGAFCGRYGTDFCADCGSSVPSAAAGSETAMLPAGAIDSPLPALPAVHLYSGSKAPWYEITDSWPRFEELPPPERLTEFFR